MTAAEYLAHAKTMWKTLVPKRGHADTYNGELLRVLENLRDEAQRNGNKNWGPRHKFKVQFLEKTLTEATFFSAPQMAAIQADLQQLLDYQRPTTSDAVYDRLMERIVDWDLAHPERPPLNDAFLAELAEHDEAAFAAPVAKPSEPSALRQAILTQNIAAVRALLQEGADLEARNEFDGTPIGGAAAVGNLDILALLLDAGANINHLDALGQSVLDMAKYRPEAKKFLKSKGAKSGRQLKKDQQG